MNFLFGITQWCVSVAVYDDDGGLAGVVFDPLRDEIFTAERGGPAMHDGSPIHGSQCAEIGESLVATGFGYEAAVRTAQAEVVAGLLPQVRDVRRMGSAALDLAWTAAGRYDAYYERGIQIWDIAAGSVLCEAAGLRVRPLEARDAAPEGLVVAPEGLLDALTEIVG